MVKIGMMIGERYEILEKIGTGGMSDVYKAKCHKLNRFVAVKVLKQEFSENANFVSKFRIEAQAAAGLMHPNIVNVYDVGEENGIYYIVMELVEGITLKKYIEKKARLSYKEAISIAIQVSMGIEAAHNNHIIHRDIKPQNIIISKDGKVKVTDFGIAKAATSNTITSNVMGSVHYTSPEQARGGYSDEKSDIYSLGITLFEMLTGRVPFNGETTVAIAIKHIQEEMPSPKEFVPEISTSVERIVLKCCQKSPDRRYQSMAELIADLKQSLMNPDEDFVVQEDPDLEASTRMISDNDRVQIKRQSRPSEIVEKHQSRLSEIVEKRPSHPSEMVEKRPSHSSEMVEDYAAEESLRLRRETQQSSEEEEEIDNSEEKDEEYDYDPKMERITTILAVAAGIVICAIIVFLLFRVFGMKNEEDKKEHSTPIITSEEESKDQSSEETTTQAQKVKMPKLLGRQAEEIRSALEKLGITVELEYVESEDYEEGIIIDADVEEGTEIEEGSSIKVTVSSGFSGVEVPDTTGKTYEDAEKTLKQEGFLVNKAESYSETIAAGLVITQNPSSGKAPRGSVVTVTVSLGKAITKVSVPNVLGLRQEEGTQELAEAGLTVKVGNSVYSEEQPEGCICYQSWSHGSYVEQGTEIEIRVSLGSEPKPVTYKYNGTIQAPTSSEAPDYVSGDNIKVVLVTDNGTELLNTTTSSFPISVNYYRLDCPTGTITFTYTVITEGSMTNDPATGEIITVPGKSEEKTFTRKVEFTQE